MARLAACPKCRNQFTLPELTGPATIACPFCGAHINIKVRGPVMPPPAMVVQPAMAAARAMPVDDDEYEDEEEEVRPKKKKKKKRRPEPASVNTGSSEVGMKIAIVGGILLLTLISIVFSFWWFLRDDGKQKIILPTELKLTQ